MLIATVVVALGLLSTSSEQDLWFNGILFAGLWLYWGVGALVVVRADGHLIGWLFAVAAAMMASVILSWGLGFQLISSQQPDPLGVWLGLLGTLLFVPAIILILPAVALTFPTGTLPGPRWRWPVRLVATMVAVRMLVIVIRPGSVFGDGDGLVNPLTPWLPAFSPSVLGVLSTLDMIGSLALPLGAGLGVAAVVVRFRRSEGDERQQLKWFLAAITPAAVLIPLSLSEVLGPVPIIDLVSVAAVPIIPVSVALAILRYRLYDIDRFISRTISYGLVTALLVAVFLVVNLGLQSVLSSFTSGNSLAVAGSTLLAAALFTPVRQRVQRIVDRRFNRARYDAERTVERFSGRLRDELDLATLAGELQRTSVAAVEPAASAVWLRKDAVR